MSDGLSRKNISKEVQLFTVLFVIIVTLYLPITALFLYGKGAAFKFFSDDTFYYLTVAKNSSLAFTTFDMERPTNGFHPLWQSLLIIFFKVVGPDKDIQVLTVFLMSCIMVTVGQCFAALAILRVTRTFYSVLWLFPGPFYMLFNFHRNVKGITYNYSCWSFMNGMESVLTMFWGGILLYFAALIWTEWERTDDLGGVGGPVAFPLSNFKTVLMGIVIAACILSRLDDVFLVFGFGFLMLFVGKNLSERIGNLFRLLGPAIVLVSSYMLISYFCYGTPLPTSGMIKGGMTISKLMTNINMFAANIFPQLASDPKYMTWSWWTISANRIAGMLVPALFALVLLISLAFDLKRGKRDYVGLLGLSPLLIYLVMKGFYNFFFVQWMAQAYWYYALAVLLFNFIIIISVFKPTVQNSVRARLNTRLVLASVWVIYFAYISGLNLSMLSGPDHYTYTLFKNRTRIEAELKRIEPNAKLLDNHDGIIGYAFDLPTMSITGLVSDIEGYQRKKNDSYLDYAIIQRGYNILSGLKGQGYYTFSSFPSKYWTPKELYFDRESGVAFVKLERKK